MTTALPNTPTKYVAIGDIDGQELSFWNCFVRMTNNAGITVFEFYYREGNPLVNHLVTTTVPVAPFRWYCLEIECFYDLVNGYYNFWIDGVNVVNRTGLNTTANGALKFCNAGVTSSDSNNAFPIYIDDVVISDEYVGLLLGLIDETTTVEQETMSISSSDGMGARLRTLRRITSLRPVIIG